MSLTKNLQPPTKKFFFQVQTIRLAYPPKYFAEVFHWKLGLSLSLLSLWLTF